MNTLLLHPSVVHLPLGLAVVMPLLLGAMVWAIASGRLPGKAWLIALALQGVVVGAAGVALWTGGREEDRVEARAGEAAVRSHERAAQAFTVAAGGTFVAIAAALVLRNRPRPFLAAGLGSTVLAIGMLVLGVHAGRQGGALVHGGAAVVQSSEKPSADPGAAGQEADEERDDD